MTVRYINTKFTLLDRAMQTIDGKTILPVIETMNELIDDFFMDVPFIEANMGLQHKIVRDAGMVASTKRTFYTGVGASKRNKQTLYEKVQLIERRREVDEDEVDTLANPQEHLRSEDQAHSRKLGEDVVRDFFNATSNDGSEEMDGLFARLGSLNPTGLNNVVGNGHSSTGTSVLIVEWNTDKMGGAHGIYPPGFIKNSNFGVSIRDKGKEVKNDEDDVTKQYYVYVAQFKAWMGLSVTNNRKIARLANINPTMGGSKSFTDGGPANLIKLLNNGRFERGRTRIYVNTTVKSQMDVYALDKANLQWSTQEVFGRPVTTFQGIPIRVMDTTIISDAQAAVV